MLALLTRHNRPFPVPWRMDAETRALLESATTRGRGLLLCSAHLPLVKVAARAFIETGQAPAAAIAESPAGDQAIAIWGLRERLPALKVDPAVLLRTRTLLRTGQSVVLLVDRQAGAGYSPNIFRLAHATRSAVLFFIPELAADGTVDVRLIPPPHPACATPDEIAENLQALDAEVRHVSLLAERPAVPVYWEFGHRAVTLFVRLLTRLLSTSAFKTR
jgi:lauroyl/myristoyl acyltransferase